MGMRRNYLLISTFVICLRIYSSDAIICYQCGDTTDDKALAPCQFKSHRLLNERRLHDKGEPLKNLHNVKNCSHYLDHRGEFVYQYCKTEEIQAHGVTAAFLRDCTDGRTFGLNVSRIHLLRPNNKTICGYSDLHVANICVSVCDTDFCNGPSAASAVISSAFFLLATMFVGLFGKQFVC